MAENLTILVVEDERIIREKLYPIWLDPIKRAFPQTEIVLLESMQSTLAYLAEHIPHVILLDLKLTDSLPDATISKIPEMVKIAPVLVVSNSADPDDRIGSMAAGAQGFFAKGDKELLRFLVKSNLSIFEKLASIDSQIAELWVLVGMPEGMGKQAKG